MFTWTMRNRSMMKGWDTMRPSLVFQCGNIDEAYERMKRNGVKFEGEPQRMPWGTFVQFYDEDGYTHLLKG